MLIIAVVATTSAQKQYQTLTGDTVIGTTTYFTPGFKLPLYDGIFAVSFRKVDIKDSLTVCKLQGAMQSDFGDAQDISDTGGYLSNTTTDGYTVLYVATPKYLYYRLKTTTASGDSVYVYDINAVYKETK